MARQPVFPRPLIVLAGCGLLADALAFRNESTHA